MKKIYICLLGFFTASAFTAQVQNSNFSPLERKNSHLVEQIKPSKLTQNTKETILWSNSFNTPSDWVINNTEGTPGLGWEFLSNPDFSSGVFVTPPPFASFASTTAANGFLFVNSDANNTADFDGSPIVTTATTTATIDLTGQPVVRLRYQHNFRWWHDTRGVSVSGDNGATWTDFEMSNETEYSLPDQNSGNPEQTVIDISSIAGNQAQVKIRFYYNDNDWWGWYWAVDDVELFVPEDYDLVMLGGYWGSTGAWGARLPYYQIPLSQLAPLDVAGIVKNYGALDQNDVVFTAALASGAWTESSAPEAVLAGATDTISLTAALTPPAIVATHVINLSASSSATDAVPADNSILAAASVSVNDYIYARDEGTATNGTYNAGEGFEAGNIFDIYASANLSGIDAYIDADAEEGAEVYARLYSVDPTATTAAEAFVFVDESAPYILTAAELGQKITLALGAGAAPLNAGESYLIVLGSYGDGGATYDLVISTAGVSEASTSYYYDMTDLTWYYTTSTPMVRMNFDPSVGVNEVQDNLGLRVFPNPANEVINISLNKEVSATITLLDVSGKVVRTQTLNGISTSINTASLNSGVYFVTINDGTSVSTQKVVIKK
jgi:hypothetical protein